MTIIPCIFMLATVNLRLFSEDTLEVLAGSLPRRAQALVLEWAAIHREELIKNWERARKGESPLKIEPLD